MHPPIRAFLFDIGNVLVRFDFGKVYRTIAAHCGVQHNAEILARVEAVKLMYEDGQVPRADFLKEIFGCLGYRGTEGDFVAAWQSIFTPNAPMVEVVRQLHGSYPLYLLSNTNDMHVEGLFRDFDYFRLFKGGTYSHVVRASKPSARIYEIACAEHRLNPAETLFLDDLEANVAAARSVGFQTHHYHPDRHDAFLAALHELGIAIR
jgi:FMN phosphatase YigB (HAD superfamily)